MLDKLKLVFTYFNDETIMVLSVLIGIVVMILFIVWYHNKRKFNNLRHQIPANVVKNYLDTIIQNSNSLKSSLFRGGGSDVSGMPSVLSMGGGGSSSSVDMEMLNRKNAEIASLQTQVIEKNSIIKDLEGQTHSLKAAAASGGGADPTEVLNLKKKNGELEGEIIKLKEQLASAGSNAGGGADPAKLAEVTKERDDLKEKLKEYEIIEDDLANLKKLQQENDELKKKLGIGGAAVAVAATAAVAAAPEPTPPPPAEEAPAAAAPEAEAPAAPEAPPAAPLPQEQGGEKSAEDLLSEFEKMLG